MGKLELVQGSKRSAREDFEANIWCCTTKWCQADRSGQPVHAGCVSEPGVYFALVI